MKKNWITAMAADSEGGIFDVDGYAAVGMAGPKLVPLTRKDTIAMPHGGELMLLPGRRPIVYHISEQCFEVLHQNPFAPDEPIYPVAVFNSPGYFNTYVTAYEESASASFLPLFSYGAVGWSGNRFRTPLVLVDKEPRQDLRFMDTEDVKRGIEAIRREMPKNRLRHHLETCALTYGCPAGKNFFLGRYEAPLPTAATCNAGCLGCISLQDHPEIQCSQKRIDFTPDPEEIAEVALYHIKRVKRAVVSFGQGCEGDPLMAAHVIEPAIRSIRKATSEGTINMNTNGGKPDRVMKLFDAGLDSIRISLNSLRQICYDGYFRPRGYRFDDVLDSIGLALAGGKFVSINYFNCPGFTDTPQEYEAMRRFLTAYPIHMIQWRNLNFDPKRYWNIMDALTPHGMPLGMKKIFNRIRREFPEVRHGYFNPPKETFLKKYE
ncbi:MAG: radical SAM protein [Desulfobacterales bacterium]